MTKSSHRGVIGSRECAEPDRRVSIRSSLEAGSVHSAIQSARLLLHEQPSLPKFRFLRQLVDRVQQNGNAVKPYKVALLSSFSIEFIHDSLIALGFINGLRIHLYQPGFGLIRQEILEDKSGLYDFSSDVTILAIEDEDPRRST